MTTRLAAAKVEPGSIILLSGVAFAGEDVETQVIDTIGEAVGHRQFCLVVADDGDLEVWGPDVDLRAKIEALLAPQGH